MKISKNILSFLLLLSLITPQNLVKAAPIIPENTQLNVSTWLWNTREIVTSKDNIINFLKDNKINTVYLQIDYSLGFDYYKSFIKMAKLNNIKIYALDGSPEWASSTGYILQNKFFTWLTKYQKAATIDEKFQGVHLDVEPYGNSSYDTDKNKILEYYMDNLVIAKRKTQKLNLDFGIDIPFWFNQVKFINKYGTGNLANWIFNRIKSVTIMAYRDTALGENGINKILEAEMNLCKKYKVKAIVAVETGALPDTNFVTFYEEGKSYMLNELNIVYKTYSLNSCFEGFAIHHLNSFMNMKE